MTGCTHTPRVLGFPSQQWRWGRDREMWSQNLGSERHPCPVWPHHLVHLCSSEIWCCDGCGGGQLELEPAFPQSPVAPLLQGWSGQDDLLNYVHQWEPPPLPTRALGMPPAQQACPLCGWPLSTCRCDGMALGLKWEFMRMLLWHSLCLWLTLCTNGEEPMLCVWPGSNPGSITGVNFSTSKPLFPLLWNGCEESTFLAGLLLGLNHQGCHGPLCR